MLIREMSRKEIICEYFLSEILSSHFTDTGELDSKIKNLTDTELAIIYLIRFGEVVKVGDSDLELDLQFDSAHTQLIASEVLRKLNSNSNLF